MCQAKFRLLEKGKKTEILYSEQENSAVHIAVNNLMQDMQKVCPCKIVLCSKFDTQTDHENPRIVIATLSTSEICNVFPKELQLYIEKIKNADGRFHWEAYFHKIIGNTLYIVGADRRGTVFGIYDLCRQMGVSPWYFWADVPIHKKAFFELSASYEKVDWPDVQYRGIFLNDEEELDAWAKAHTVDGTIGPCTYEKIYELLLRLKGNYIWPAMHVNCFNENPENAKLADRMGIIVGTSHCDMLLRSNQNEWKPWLQKKGYDDTLYDYSIEGENRERIHEYWMESVENNKDYEVCYTVGMRGIHDSGFVTKNIDENTELNAQQKKKKKIELLGQVITDQRQILRDVLGEKRGKHALQTFIPYKEVLDLYDSGLDLPEDITLIWVDDNFGYMRRYPNQKERTRSGGNGLYYHASYWAHPGMSYLFFNSIPLAQTGNELKKCWESGIRKMWVLNVGALKPLEMDIEYFLRYGWEADRETSLTKDTRHFVSEWINDNFLGEYGNSVSSIYHSFAQLNNICKPEHLTSEKYSQIAYGNEAKKRLDCLATCKIEAEKIYEQLSDKEKPAFFQLFLMKIQASYYINASFYFADRSRLLWKLGAMQGADECIKQLRKMDKYKQMMLYYYNYVMNDGKWSGILTPESFSPPPTALFPAGKPALKIGKAQLGVFCPEEIKFHAHGRTSFEIILFNKGKGNIRYKLDCPHWLSVTDKSGIVTGEKILEVCVAPEYKDSCFKEEKRAMLKIAGENGEMHEIPVQTILQVSYPQKKAYYAEADGYLCIPADGYQKKDNNELICWRQIRDLGREGGNAMELAPAEKNEYAQKENTLDYSIFVEHSGDFILELYRFLTLRPGGAIKVSVWLDEDEPIMLTTETTDEWKGSWKKAVMNDGEILTGTLKNVHSGLHTLHVASSDLYFTFSKTVIYTREKLKSNMGPLVSPFFDGSSWKQEEKKHLFEGFSKINWSEEYGTPSEEALLLPMLYADIDFWKSERLYTVSDQKADRLAPAKYIVSEDGSKDVVSLFGSGRFCEQNGTLAIEAEYALENSQNAFLTAGVDANHNSILWEHTQAETDGKTGLAMMIEPYGLFWNNIKDAPGMHYKIQICHSGTYILWMLMKFDDTDTDLCALALDGHELNGEIYQQNGEFFTYSMKQRWHWRAVASFDIAKGEHILSVFGKKSCLRIDRIYVTNKREWPPVDADWQPTKRI